MTLPSHPHNHGNPFARPSIWPPMPKTAFRVAPPVGGESRPARASQASILSASAVPSPRPDVHARSDAHAGQLFEPQPALAPEPQPPAGRALSQSAPPIPRPRPIPDGPVNLAGRARTRRDRPPILALTVASLAGGIGLAALFLLLGRAAEPARAPEATPPPPTSSIASLQVGQVISPSVPGLRGPVAAEAAEVAAAPAEPAPAPDPGPAPAAAPVARAAATPPPRPAQLARPSPKPAASATAALPRLTGPVSDEPFLTVTTRRIAPPASQPSPSTAQALADAPFVSPRRPSVPLVPYVRPPTPSADEPISTTPFGDSK